MEQETNMIQIRTNALRGFTIIELMISIVVLSIIAISIGTVIVDGQNSWNSMYNRIHSNVVSDGYVARKKFDSIIRMSSNENITIAEDVVLYVTGDMILGNSCELIIEDDASLMNEDLSGAPSVYVVSKWSEGNN